MKLWPLESISNVTQMIALIVIAIWVWAVSGKTKEPVIARFFALGIFTVFLGDLFWSVYILLFGQSPSGISPADIAWIGGYCFLTGLLQITVRGKRRPRWLVIAPVIVACDAAVWLSWADGNFGSILNDIVYALVLGVMSWFVVANLIDDNEAMRPFSIATMVYLIMELCLFTSWGIMYAVFDLAVTLSMIVMAVTFVKGISAKEVLV